MRISRITLLSTHPVLRQALAELLRKAGYAVEAVSTLGSRTGDAVVVDLDHAAHDAMTVVRQVAEAAPHALMIVLGSPLRLAASLDRLDGTEVDTVRDDHTALLARLRGKRSRSSNALAAAARTWERVTPRQRDVLRWLAMGLDNAAVARKLRIGERAVKAHITALLVRFDQPNRTALALLAERAGLRPPNR